VVGRCWVSWFYAIAFSCGIPFKSVVGDARRNSKWHLCAVELPPCVYICIFVWHLAHLNSPALITPKTHSPLPRPTTEDAALYGYNGLRASA